MFQSTPPRGERHAKSIVSPLPETVSIHAPAWGATDVLYRSYVHLLVSIHAPAWGATERPLTDSEAQGVSIHAPAWGATPRRSCLSRRAIVSIHAPAWGATLRISFASSQVSFQSTSPRGERHDIITTTLLHDYFNPRPRVGSDRRHDRPVYRVRISIHVPAWGATCSFCSFCSDILFQSTSPRGERPHPVGADGKIDPFQSTSPRGERQVGKMVALLRSNFNPRPRVGSDRPNFQRMIKDSEFQSTSPRGERLFVMISPAILGRFQSTSPRGERPRRPGRRGPW